jgi:hypothetical protein
MDRTGLIFKKRARNASAKVAQAKLTAIGSLARFAQLRQETPLVKLLDRVREARPNLRLPRFGHFGDEIGDHPRLGFRDRYNLPATSAATSVTGNREALAFDFGDCDFHHGICQTLKDGKEISKRDQSLGHCDFQLDGLAADFDLQVGGLRGLVWLRVSGKANDGQRRATGGTCIGVECHGDAAPCFAVFADYCQAILTS